MNEFIRHHGVNLAYCYVIMIFITTIMSSKSEEVRNERML